MKLFFVIASLLFVVSANAADRKVGNVVAIEREIADVYSTCLKNMADQDTSKSAYSFYCSIPFLNDGELSITKGGIIRLIDNRCVVAGDVTNGKIFITFNTAKNLSTFEESRLCLQRSLTPSNSKKVIIYTIE